MFKSIKSLCNTCIEAIQSNDTVVATVMATESFKDTLSMLREQKRKKEVREYLESLSSAERDELLK